MARRREAAQGGEAARRRGPGKSILSEFQCDIRRKPVNIVINLMLYGTQ